MAAPAPLAAFLEAQRGGLREVRLRFYDWLDVSIWAADSSYVDDVRARFWPFVGEGRAPAAAYNAYIIEAALPADALAPFARESVRLYNAHDGDIPTTTPANACSACPASTGWS
jgi:hypothetical protein